MFDRHPFHCWLGRLLCACLASFLTEQAGVWAADEVTHGYREPPRDIVELLTESRFPDVSVSPTANALLLATRERFTPLADLARPVVRLGAIDVDLTSSAPRRLRFESLSLVDLRNYESIEVTPPGETRVDFPIWSPSGEHFAFSTVNKDAVRLWVGNAAEESAHLVPQVELNASFGHAFRWMPDGRRLLCRLKVTRQAELSAQGLFRPLIMDTEAGAIREAASDREVAPYDLAQVQLALLDLSTGNLTRVGRPVRMRDAQPSPDGRFLLVLPISVIPLGPHRVGLREEAVEVWDLQGRLVTSLPTNKIEHRSNADGVFQIDRHRRRLSWRLSADATLVYGEIEAASSATGGNGERLMAISEPFDVPPLEIFHSENFITRVAWIAGTDLAYLRDFDPIRRQSSAYLIDVGKPGQDAKLLWTTDVDARSDRPSEPLGRGDLLMQQDNSIFLAGQRSESGAVHAYLERMSLTSLERERIWTSDDSSVKEVVALLARDASRLLVRHERADAALSYAVHELADSGRYPVAEVRRHDLNRFGVHEQLMKYRRKGGLWLTAMLYTPSNRRDGERLPLILWGYPRTYENLSSAKRACSPRPHAPSTRRAIPLFLALRGYAVMDQISLPIIKGWSRSFSQQLVESAKAAVDQAVAIGVGDPERVGIGGHSFGAFSTVTLLAHSELFRAGVALSGAYNRTLTPFGFQTERRTLWEAPDHYLAMSPFLQAHRINEPLLLLHGERDNNAGTTPMQSELLFQAMRRVGGTARLVMLPFEGHVYRARESVLHSAAEMLDWFDRYVKGEPDGQLVQADPPSG
jgi:dipeptidyl aminopeptidase/acylaminoacyl peptidase